MIKKLGRRPAIFTAPRMRASFAVNEVLASFGPPPVASANFIASVKHPWGMYLNDQLGDCVCADTAHGLLLRTSCAGTPVVAADSDVLALYEAVGGYKPGDPSTDQGCNEGDMCEYLITTGFLGHKSTGTASVVTGQVTSTLIDHMKWACQIFVGLRLGVNLPASAETQFDGGVPWDVGGDETIVGGHDVGMGGYTPQYALVTTWGAVQKVTWPWIMKFVEEAHAEIFADAIRANGLTPGGFHLATLERDLAALAV